MRPLLGTIQKSVGLVPRSAPSKVSVKRVCSTVTGCPPTFMVDGPRTSPVMATFSAGLVSEQVARPALPRAHRGGRR